MKKKQLPLRKPLFSAQTVYGSMFSVLRDDCMEWVYNNMIQIRFAFNWNVLCYNRHQYLMENCPGLEYFKIPYSFIVTKYNDSIIETLIDILDKGYYIMMYIDRYYLPNHKQYKTEHDGGHEAFVSGYDMEKKTFTISDNLGNGKYGSYECDMRAVEDGFNYIPNDHLFKKEIQFIRPRECKLNGFHKEQVLAELKRYYNSTPSYDFIYEQEYIFGFDIYDKLIHEGMDRWESLHKRIDVRHFYMLYEHKLLMEMRVKFMMEHGYLDPASGLLERITEIKEMFITIEYLVIKHNCYMESGKNLYQKVRDSIAEAVPIERKYIEDLIKALDNNGK